MRDGSTKFRIFLIIRAEKYDLKHKTMQVKFNYNYAGRGNNTEAFANTFSL